MERRNEAESSIFCILLIESQRDRKIMERRGRRRKSEGAEMPALKKKDKMRNPPSLGATDRSRQRCSLGLKSPSTDNNIFTFYSA
jgi:hypothetical protein